MKTKAGRKIPEIIFRQGQPTGVILDIKDYREMLERLEDLEEIKIINEILEKPHKFASRGDLLKKYKLRSIDKEEVLKTIEEHRDKIKTFGVRRLGLFGSCVRGEASSFSDLDFIVELENETFDAYMDLKLFLEDLFDCEVDLVMVNAIKPALRDAILGEAVYAKGF